MVQKELVKRSLDNSLGLEKKERKFQEEKGKP